MLRGDLFWQVNLTFCCIPWHRLVLHPPWALPPVPTFWKHRPPVCVTSLLPRTLLSQLFTLTAQVLLHHLKRRRSGMRALRCARSMGKVSSETVQMWQMHEAVNLPCRGPSSQRDNRRTTPHMRDRDPFRPRHPYLTLTHVLVRQCRCRVYRELLPCPSALWPMESPPVQHQRRVPVLQLMYRIERTVLLAPGGVRNKNVSRSALK